ncbi:Terminal uridylyltransferase 4 [Linnemannia exigua]|uniref:Terminal uridylyltransferase 4 n=1 Tax=Linnemannia exigua TaxID=604196 RepID=A0AAD4DEZ0_9FUNG|nr:Terminal uridylyltransferase 4 [Linnemannia exigua]
MSINSATTLSAAEWTGILYDLILFENSGKYACDSDEYPINNIADALMNAWYWQENKGCLSNCPVDSYISKNSLYTPDGITMYINTTRRHTFSIFPYPLTVRTKNTSYHLVGINQKGVIRTDFVSLPKLSGRDQQDFLDDYAAIIPSNYHDDFATVIQHLRDNCWIHGGSGGRTRLLANGLEGVTKFSKKHNDKKRLVITHILPGELERRRAFSRQLEINAAVRQKQDFTRPDAQKPEQNRKQPQDDINILEKRLDAMRLEVEERQQLKERQEMEARAQRIASITRYMITLQTSQMPTDDIINSVQDLRQALQAGLRRYTGRENVTVHLLGSFESGLASKTSDADFTAYNFFSPNSRGNSIAELANALRWAGLPIVSFTAGKFQCDMSMDQHMGVINSKLIATYRKIDNRFLTLWFTIRLIAKKHEILSGSTRYLSSYALAMMLIVFLQDVCNPPILPRLQQQNRRQMLRRMIDGYDCSFDHNWSNHQKFGGANTTSVGQLLIDFCRFYGYTFKYATEELNPCLGVVKSRSFNPPPRSPADRRPKDWAMCVLDPFIAGRNVAGNSQKHHVAKIQKCFQEYAFGEVDVGDLKKAFER